MRELAIWMPRTLGVPARVALLAMSVACGSPYGANGLDDPGWHRTRTGDVIVDAADFDHETIAGRAAQILAINGAIASNPGGRVILRGDFYIDTVDPATGQPRVNENTGAAYPATIYVGNDIELVGENATITGGLYPLMVTNLFTGVPPNVTIRDLHVHNAYRFGILAYPVVGNLTLIDNQVTADTMHPTCDRPDEPRCHGPLTYDNPNLVGSHTGWGIYVGGSVGDVVARGNYVNLDLDPPTPFPTKQVLLRDGSYAEAAATSFSGTFSRPDPDTCEVQQVTEPFQYETLLLDIRGVSGEVWAIDNDLEDGTTRNLMFLDNTGEAFGFGNRIACNLLGSHHLASTYSVTGIMAWNGFFNQGPGGAVQLRDNRVDMHPPRGAGIVVGTGAMREVFDPQQIDEDGTCAIVATFDNWGTGATVMDNRVSLDDGTAGITVIDQVDPGLGVGVLVSDNTVIGNALNGIVVGGGDALDATNCCSIPDPNPTVRTEVRDNLLGALTADVDILIDTDAVDTLVGERQGSILDLGEGTQLLDE